MKRNRLRVLFPRGHKRKSGSPLPVFWTKSGENIEEYLRNFEGSVIMTDGYSGYDSMVEKFNEIHPAHNNAAEQAVRPFTVGRKNWLFAGSGEGARAASLIYSLIETAKLQNLVPEDYLRCLFEKAPYAETPEAWENLLPWNIEVTPFIPRCEVIGLTGEN